MKELLNLFIDIELYPKNKEYWFIKEYMIKIFGTSLF